MRCPSLWFLLAVGTALMPRVGFAQSDAPLRVTLGEALQRAARDPPAVRLALARAAAAHVQIDAARAGYYPTVTAGLNGNFAANLAGSFSRSQGPQFVMGIPVGTGRTETANDSSGLNLGASASVTARIPIWDFGRTSNAVTAAERGEDAAGADLELARMQAMGAVGAAFLSVLSDQESVTAAQAILTQREAHLRIAEGLVTAGARPPIERTRAQVDLDIARLGLTLAEGRLFNDRVVLATALGIDPVRSVEVVPPDEQTLTADDDPARAADAAVRARPELASARIRVAQAEAQARAARAARAPILSGQASLTAGASTSSSSNDSQTNGRVIGTSTNASNALQGNVTGTVSLTVPLFDPTIRANIQAADVNLTSARTTLAQQSLLVRSAAAQAAQAARIARIAFDQAERLAVTAAANLDQATGRYQSGAAPLLEIVDAQAADASARVQVITARLALHTARVSLLVATGDISRLAR